MRVLLIEAEPDVFQRTKKFLNDEGYAVESADGIEEGLFKGVTSDHDAIVIDITLPRSNGWQVVKQLRHRKKNVPILILTTPDALEDRMTGLEIVSNDYMLKPLLRAEFISRVRSLVQASDGSDPPVIEIGSVSINRSQKTVTANDEVISLTSKEFQLFEMLAVRRGQLVTRREIYARLFDYDDASLANLVDVYVSNIRRKVGGGLIKTRRGMGYIIEE